MSNTTDIIIIRRKPSGNYVIDLDEQGERRVGAAKGSPVAQAIRLLDRLLQLADRLGAYNE